MRLLVPVAAPVILARTVCPASRSFALVNPVTGNPGCPVRMPKSTGNVDFGILTGQPGLPVTGRMPKSTGNVAVGLTVRQTPLPKPAVARGEPLVTIELSLMIMPKFAPPLQLLG